MTEVGTAVPPAGSAPPPIRRAPQSPTAQFGWAVVSTVALAAWIAWQFDWVWALAGVCGILVHETGHLLVINAFGYGPSRIHIIPFFGGVATMKRTPRTEFHGVLIALAGPAAGLIAAIPFILASVVAHDPRWAGGGFFIAIINLVNMAPAPPLDGSKALGPALARIHPVVERGALLLVSVMAAYWAFSRGSFLFGAFIVIAALGSLRRGAVRPNAERLTNGQWLAAVVLWLAVLALCLAVLLVSAKVGFIDAPLRFLGWR